MDFGLDFESVRPQVELSQPRSSPSLVGSSPGLTESTQT